MADPYSKEELVKNYLEAEAKRAKSKSIWLMLGGLVFGVLGAIGLSKFGINDLWAIIPGWFVVTVGFMRVLKMKVECDEAYNRMRDCANLSPEEFHRLRGMLNGE